MATTTTTTGNAATTVADTSTSSGNNNSGGGGSGGTGAEAGGGGGGSSIVQQYIPKQNNGQWMAIGSIVGSIFGRLYDSGTLAKAQDAETIWRTLTDTVKDRGVSEFTTHADVLLTCNDALWVDLCAFAEKGYCPDYRRILNNARSAAAAAFDTQTRSALRQANRYGTGLNADVLVKLRIGEASSVVTAYAMAAEQARQFMWTSNYDMLRTAAAGVESARMGRITTGGELVAAAGQNYANVAQSLRQTAAMDVGDYATLGSLLGVVLPLLFQYGCSPTSGCD